MRGKNKTKRPVARPGHPLSALVRAALAVALCIISLTVFRGMLNIINALFIPLIIVVFTTGANKRIILALSAVLLALCLIFFLPQAFFVLLYCLLAAIIKHLLDRRCPLLLILLLTTLTSSSGFAAAALVTDFVFSTQIIRLTIGMLNGSILLYAMLLLLEGLLIAGIQIPAVLFIRRKLLRL